MRSTSPFIPLAVLSVSALLLSLVGCGDGGSAAPPAAATGASAQSHDHDHDHGHDHAEHADAEHGHGVQLGEQQVGGWTIRAVRNGDIAPGKDAAMDVWVAGASTKVDAVRIWIGTQDGKGSTKARAEWDKDRWHTHVEVPKPLPDASKLWVEVETSEGKSLCSFDLKL
jgi:hypothetical protein